MLRQGEKKCFWKRLTGQSQSKASIIYTNKGCTPVWLTDLSRVRRRTVDQSSALKGGWKISLSLRCQEPFWRSTILNRLLLRYLWGRILRLQNINNNNQLSLRETGKVDDFIQSGTDQNFGSDFEKRGGGPLALIYLWLFTFWLSIHNFFSYSSGPRINVLQALRQDIADEIVAKFTLFTRSKGELRALTLRVSICQNLPTPGFTLVLSYITDYEKHCVDYKQTKQSG